MAAAVDAVTHEYENHYEQQQQEEQPHKRREPHRA